MHTCLEFLWLQSNRFEHRSVFVDVDDGRNARLSKVPARTPERALSPAKVENLPKVVRTSAVILVKSIDSYALPRLS